MNYNIKEKKEIYKINSIPKTEREKRIKYKAIKIPKLLLNKKINDFDNSKRYINSQNITKNISSTNFIFIQNPRMKELSQYYYSKNRSLINEISSNSKRKLKTLRTSEGINDLTKRKRLNIRSRLFDYEISKKNINNSAPNINKNKNNKNIEDIMNESFLSSKIDDPLLKFKIRKYLKNKLTERYNLYSLINYPFSKKSKGKNVLYSNMERKLILKRLIKPKKIDNDVYDTIIDEYKNAKSNFDSNKSKQNDKVFEKKILKYKLNKNKPENKIFKSDFVSNIGDIQKSMVENHTNLIKNKLNNNITGDLNVDYLNEFNTNLHLSLSYPKDQLFNTRLYAKFINDNSYIKNLIEEVSNKYIKKI